MKSNKKAFPFMSLFIGAAAALVVMVPVRIYQYLKIIEPETGFYSAQNFSVYIIYAVMLFSVIFSFITAFTGRKTIAAKKVIDTPKINACAFLLAGIGFASDAVSSIIDFMDIYGKYSYNPTLTLSKYLSQEGGNIILIQAVFAVLSAVYFALLAGSAYSKNDIAPKLRALSLSATIWAVMKLLMMFKTKISFINVSDLFIELFACAFLMLFFFYFAVNLSQVDKGESYYKLFAYGIPGAVFSLACFIPRAVLALIGKGEMINENYGVSFSALMLALGVIAALIARAYTVAKNSSDQ